ncbi:hypothetical protein COCNU_scaffold009299G000010 [Cocos nucifera]|nr:hypothetical protein [Cocos nucifera]
MAPAIANVALEIYPKKEVILTIYVDVVEGESLPLERMNLPTRDCMLDPSTNEGKERRKRKAAITKKAHMVHQDEPFRSSNDDQGMDPFNNPDIIQNLTDKFTLPEEVDCLADLG